MTPDEEATHHQTNQVLAYMRPHVTAMANMVDPAAVCRGLAIVIGSILPHCVSSEEEKLFAIDAIGQLVADTARQMEALDDNGPYH